MNNEQRKYIVEKIEKKENEVEENRKRTIINAFLLGLSGLAALASVVTNISGSTLLWKILLLVNTSYTVYNLKEMLDAIAKKTGLETEVNMLQSQLDLDYLKDNKGHTL